MVIARRLAASRLAGAGTSLPELPASVPLVAVGGIVGIMAALVASTAIGSGDYGQWLMVSRAFGGATTPAYRALSDVPPLVPTAIAMIARLVSDPILALHLIGFLIVAGLGSALFAVGRAVDGRTSTGLVAVVLGLLVTDRYLELLAFGGLLQAAAIVFLLVAVGAFTLALANPARERRWWMVGSAALFATCLTHVPTATLALPVCLAAAALSVLPRDGMVPRTGAGFTSRLRTAWPLGAATMAIAAYWVVVIAPASIGYVANPASLAWRGPERVIEVLAAYPPTLVIIGLGGVYMARWAWHLVRDRRLPAPTDPRSVLGVWIGASWGAYLFSAVTGAATDYPRFGPLLLAPLLVAAAAAIGAAGASLHGRWPGRATGERGLVAIGLAIVVVAPFSIARYQSEAHGYELTDDRALAAAAAWADSRLVPGVSILAPVREAKWIEGLTGRPALFSSQIRYAFRPIEWERGLAASALLRANLAMANESFVLTMTDGAPSSTDGQPRSVIIGANHGGEIVDLLRLVPASLAIVDGAGVTIASLPALKPDGLDTTQSPDRLATTTRWTGTRAGSPVSLTQAVSIERGTTWFDLDLHADTGTPISAVVVELRPPSGVALTDVVAANGTAELTFARLGRSAPRLRLAVSGGSIAWAPSGGLIIRTQGPDLSLRVTDLTAGGASTSLRLLDPRTLVADYDVGAAILRRDPSYEDRRRRLEALGFHVAHVEGPYVVMVRTGAAVPAR
ncbi:MAG: hypothetical protein EPO00_11345 [Chloroflexota bacterium]|nr:MAG: hypothetical protein EPO00_11345 [Chloroflexota bacterium]